MNDKIYEIGFSKEDFIDDKDIYKELDRRIDSITVKKSFVGKIKDAFKINKKSTIEENNNIKENNYNDKENEYKSNKNKIIITSKELTKNNNNYNIKNSICDM